MESRGRRAASAILMALVDPTSGKSQSALMAATCLDEEGYCAGRDYLCRRNQGSRAPIRYLERPGGEHKYLTVRVAHDREIAEFEQILGWTLHVECLGPEPFNRKSLMRAACKAMNCRTGQWQGKMPPTLPPLFNDAMSSLPLTPTDRQRLPETYVEAVIDGLLDRNLIARITGARVRHPWEERFHLVERQIDRSLDPCARSL